jgi:hypothetical protein
VSRWQPGRSALAALVLLCAPPALALDFAAGPRIGVARSPNALFFGAGFLLSGLGIERLQPLRVEGSADLQIGEERRGERDRVSFRALQLNLSLEYPILPPSRIVQVYPLVGAGWYRLQRRDCEAVPELPCRTTGFGVNLGGGVQYRRFTADATLGIGAVPTLSVTGSYLFGL